MSHALMGRPVSTDVPARAREFCRSLVEAAHPHVAAVILYGSQLHRASPSEHSAWDLVVVVRDYDGFHRAMHAVGHQQRAPWKMNLLSPVLPPYVTAFAPPGVDGTLAKCVVVSRSHLKRALAPSAADHFLKGRLVQHVETIWTDSPEEAEEMADLLATARRDVLRWAGPFLDETFTAETLTRDMLVVSFAGELRPESRDRVGEVWESQADWLRRTYGELLQRAAVAGTLEETESGRFRFTTPPGRIRRLRVRMYFFWSKVRGTLRWGKHIVTFNDWLTYIQRKTERRTGLEIELTSAERRWPLIFLWPRVIRVLRYSRTHERAEPGGGADGEPR